ncbi:MAG: hypothetical protein AB1611_05485 [bacterium]
MNSTFTINVLTPGQRKVRYAEANKVLFFLLPVVIWAVLAYGLYAGIYLPICQQIREQQTTLGELNLELTRLNSQQSKLKSQQDLCLAASGERIDWSAKLVSFSLLIPEDIWITRVLFAEEEKSADKLPALEIYGQTVSRSNRESLDKIAIFIEEMNKDDSFRQDFSPLEFVYSQLQNEQKNIVDFKLSSLARTAQVQGGDKQ